MSSTFIIRCVYVDIMAPQKGTAKCGIGSEGTVTVKMHPLWSVESDRSVKIVVL